MKKRLKNIEIHPTFFVLMFVLIFLKLGKYFFILFAITTLHESTHVLIALLYKCKPGKITLLPLGEIANIEGIEQLSPVRRIFVAFAGPMINIFLGAVLYCFLWGKWDIADYIITANFAIGFFNLLPIYPLDGGKITHIIFGNIFGIINSNHILYKLSRILAVVLVVLGFIQVILYPYNLSVLGMGMYISFTSKKERINMSYTFYQNIMSKPAKLDIVKHIRLENVLITQNTDIDTALKTIKWDCYHVFHIYDGKSIIKQISETELLDYALEKGIKEQLGAV